MNPTSLRNVLIILCLAWGVSSCEKPRTFEEQVADQVIVDARISAGEPVTDVYVHGLAAHNTPDAFANLDVLLKAADGQQEIHLQPDADKPGSYKSATDELVQEDMIYTLAFYFNERVVRAETMVPPLMETIDSSKDYIDTEMQGDLIFVDWSGINSGSFNQYFYLLELIPLDEEPESLRSLSAVNAMSDLGSKSINYNNSATLSLDDFHFYGEHVIRISAVDKVHEALFEAQMEVNQNGPTNISGGFGSFYAASSIETVIDIRR